MSNFFHGKMFAKISELDETVEFDTADEFVVVKDQITQKISGLDLTESIVSIGNLASKAYVDAVVDGAPELLNTLNEIAAALNDDSNFASNIISAIDTKLPTANFGLEFWSALEGVNTFHIAEGSNLYYTQARFDAALAAKTTTALAEGDNLYWTQARFDAALSSKSTSDTTEGSNLYYTQARFDSAFDTKTTTALAEGSNLYYTQARFDSAFDTKTTTDVAEGTNLYFTEQRVLDIIVEQPTNRLANGSLEVILNASGTLTLPAEPTSDSHAATKGYVDSQVNTIESDRLINGSFEAVLQSDGTLVLPVSPISDSHAATKGYVDSQVTDVVAGQGFATLDYVEDAINTALDVVASQFTTENLNVKNIAFTGTGAVNITSGNDLKFTSVGDITFNGSKLSLVATSGLSGELTWNVYPTEASLPNAITKHGMFAHVHGTGHGYMAHSGNWIKLANYSDIPADINQLTDVDTITRIPVVGEALVWDGSNWVPGASVTSVLADASLDGGTF